MENILIISFPHKLIDEYRVYDKVYLHQIEMMWLDEMLTLFQSINKAMKYPSEIEVELIVPSTVGYRTYPCATKIIKQMGMPGL